MVLIKLYRETSSVRSHPCLPHIKQRCQTTLMSYRVLFSHKACLSLVRHGWLVVLLGNRTSSAKSYLATISRCALETSGHISISRSRFHQLDFLIDASGNGNFTDCVFLAVVFFSSRSPDQAAYACATEWCRNGNECAARLTPASGQSIKAVFEYSHGSANRMKEKAAAVATCQTRQRKHVAVSRNNLKEKNVWYFWTNLTYSRRSITKTPHPLCVICNCQPIRIV